MSFGSLKEIPFNAVNLDYPASLQSKSTAPPDIPITIQGHGRIMV